MPEQSPLSVVDQQARQAHTQATVCYEQPLNERIRGFLRLEYLFQLVAANAAGESAMESHAAVTCLVDIGECLQRAELKSDLIKELDRQSVTLNNLASNPQVDTRALETLLQRLQGLAKQLKDLRQLGQALRNDELISAVRQRIVIAGGTSNFDLPGYHFWLHRSAAERQQRLRQWRTELLPVEAAVAEILAAIRQSAYPTHATAKGGLFQRTLEPVGSYQLVRVVLPQSAAVYPEISAGRHRFSLRFMEWPVSGGRAVQTADNIDFQLHCCML